MKNEHLVRLALIVMVVAVGLGAVAMFFLPATFDAVGQAFEPGLGLRTSVIIGFFISVAIIAFFAVVAGDSFFGELETMVVAFLLFFVIFSITTAWVF
jgi:hypothetical protein